MGRAGSCASLALLGAMLAGCSLSGLDSAYGLDGGSASDASATDAADARVSASDSGDSGDACQAAENCTNGIDDDCNGLVDCADPHCTMAGFACTAAAVPSGWTFIAFSEKTRPVCPAMYDAEQTIVSGVAGAADGCGCTCSGSAATCGGTATYTQYTSPGACVSNPTGVNLGVNNGACGATGTSVTSGDFYQLYYASTAQAQQGACTGAGKVTTAPAPTFDAGATCDGPTQLGGGCSTGACAPPTGAVFVGCISHPGKVACPTFGFTQQTLASTGTPGWVDERTCGTCPCATGLTCGTVSNVALFTNGTCADGAAYNINTGCQEPMSSGSIGSYVVSYASSGDTTCQPTGASAPGGSVTLDSNVETICCAP
jgi:hypothetical protein